MKCPKCNGEMEHGYLYSGQASGFPWYPDGQKPAKYIPEFRTKQKRGIIFGKPVLEPFEFDTLSFFVCRNCRVGIADCLTEK